MCDSYGTPCRRGNEGIERQEAGSCKSDRVETSLSYFVSVFFCSSRLSRRSSRSRRVFVFEEQGGHLLAEREGEHHELLCGVPRPREPRARPAQNCRHGGHHSGMAIVVVTAIMWEKWSGVATASS